MTRGTENPFFARRLKKHLKNNRTNFPRKFSERRAMSERVIWSSNGCQATVDGCGDMFLSCGGECRAVLTSEGFAELCLAYLGRDAKWGPPQSPGVYMCRHPEDGQEEYTLQAVASIHGAQYRDPHRSGLLYFDGWDWYGPVFPLPSAPPSPKTSVSERLRMLAKRVRMIRAVESSNEKHRARDADELESIAAELEGK